MKTHLEATIPVEVVIKRTEIDGRHEVSVRVAGSEEHVVFVRSGTPICIEAKYEYDAVA